MRPPLLTRIFFKLIVKPQNSQKDMELVLVPRFGKLGIITYYILTELFKKE